MSSPVYETRVITTRPRRSVGLSKTTYSLISATGFRFDNEARKLPDTKLNYRCKTASFGDVYRRRGSLLWVTYPSHPRLFILSNVLNMEMHYTDFFRSNAIKLDIKEQKFGRCPRALE